MIRTKSVWTPIDKEADGLRILIARFRGRGLPQGICDIWMPNLGPTEELLRAVQSGAVTWAEFGKRYRDELFEGGSIDQRNPTIRNHGQKFTLRLLNRLAAAGPVTLMCHCDEAAQQCHRFVLQELLKRSDLAPK